ncbi:hypothetical protein A5722_15045 [Mycobacterium vulneris]|nr:hypothetical protein A5722_15045 [Mycolicibacterium vulneris]OCB66237.1 hypothetical protein A5729_12550 [Mycolicibacterium vulneris]
MKERSTGRRLGYRLSEVSDLSGIGLRTIQRRVAEGDLVAHRTGSIVVVFENDLNDWLSSFERVKPTATETETAQDSMEFEDAGEHLDGAA